MASRLAEIASDCADAEALARFWGDVLGYAVLRRDEDWVTIGPADDEPPVLAFAPVPEPKSVKNRLHLDVRPSAGITQAEEVRRLLALGARRADVGQGADLSWVVLADPEGNEFCVLAGRGAVAPQRATRPTTTRNSAQSGGGRSPRSCSIRRPRRRSRNAATTPTTAQSTRIATVVQKKAPMQDP